MTQNSTSHDQCRHTQPVDHFDLTASRLQSLFIHTSTQNTTVQNTHRVTCLNIHKNVPPHCPSPDHRPPLHRTPIVLCAGTQDGRRRYWSPEAGWNGTGVFPFLVSVDRAELICSVTPLPSGKQPRRVSISTRRKWKSRPPHSPSPTFIFGTVKLMKNRLQALKKKLGEQREHLDELEKHVYVTSSSYFVDDELTKQ